MEVFLVTQALYSENLLAHRFHGQRMTGVKRYSVHQHAARAATCPIATPIRYSFTESPIGRMLIAATDKGICSIQFADSEEELEQGLKHEFPFALRRRDDHGMAGLAGQVVQRISGAESSTSLPLDIRATAFQRRVWSYLQSIAFGKTQSYTDVAKGIRHPSAVRAVARACATNPVAIAIPCHRVLRSNGDLGGYRWGLQRKKALLGIESARSQ